MSGIKLSDLPEDLYCPATIIARTDDNDEGKWRRCELDKGHDGDHETTYCGRTFRWTNAKKKT